MSPVFYALAFVTVAGAVAAMTLRDLVHSVLCLVLTFTGLAALYLQLGAQFVGLAQVLVYVGAVAILIVFVVLLTRSDERLPGAPIGSGSWWVGLLVAGAVFGSLVVAIRSSALQAPSTRPASKPGLAQRAPGSKAAPVIPANGNRPRKEADPGAGAVPPSATVREIGLRLLATPENYVLPLEVAGLLLTAAMIGAAVIAMPEKEGKR